MTEIASCAPRQPDGVVALDTRPDRGRSGHRTLDVRGDLFGLAHGGAPGTEADVTVNLPLISRKLGRCAAPSIATPTPDSSTTTIWCARRASPSRNRI